MGDISEAKMKESFNKFDTDKSGYVDPAEIKAVIKDMDPTIDARVLDGVVKVSKMKFHHLIVPRSLQLQS